MNTIIKSGFLLINKPVGISSYGCIGHIKRIFRQMILDNNAIIVLDGVTPLDGSAIGGNNKAPRYKIGHAGTLDPFASGLLIVAIGREATRLLSQCMAMEKIYIASGKCGELTDTLDLTGKVVATSEIIPAESTLRTALDSFGSSYEQIPPLYSALKHQGKPMYLLARKNMMDEQQLQEIAQAKSRTIQLYEKQFLSYEPPFFTIQIRVSQGTYIRTLINDIATRAGSCATTYQLCRTAIGPFTLDQAIEVSLLTAENINDHVISSDVFFL